MFRRKPKAVHLTEAELDAMAFLKDEAVKRNKKASDRALKELSAFTDLGEYLHIPKKKSGT
jgi:hypothetical protein